MKRVRGCSLARFTFVQNAISDLISVAINQPIVVDFFYLRGNKKIRFFGVGKLLLFFKEQKRFFEFLSDYFGVPNHHHPGCVEVNGISTKPTSIADC